MTVAADTCVRDAFDQFQAEDQELDLVLPDVDVVGLVTASDALKAEWVISKTRSINVCRDRQYPPTGDYSK